MKPSFWIKTGLLSVFLYMPAPYAEAGFEWVPPSATIQQAPRVQSVVPAPMAPPPSMMAPQSSMPAVAMPSVIAEPIAPQTRNATMNPVTAMPRPSMASSPSTGLYINPYPLQGNPRQPESKGVNIAMSERGGALTPVQLGNGMSSGMMAPRAPQVRAPVRKSATVSNYNKPSLDNDLTPMMGGEPAPMMLDGMPQGIFNGAPRAPVMAAPLSAPTQQYAQAVGFGKQLPMTLALSQVIPSEFTYRFEGDVNTDANVSWDGGQSWDVVLQNMLRTQNLRAFIQGNQVVIAPNAKI